MRSATPDRFGNFGSPSTRPTNQSRSACALWTICDCHFFSFPHEGYHEISVLHSFPRSHKKDVYVCLRRLGKTLTDCPERLVRVLAPV